MHEGSMSDPALLFAAYGLAMQAGLVVFFAVHRWRPAVAERHGLAAYAIGWFGIAVALALLLEGAPVRLVIGPCLAAAWGVYGAFVDVWRPRRWRGNPVVWTVLGPYVVLYFFAQMFLWWPLWDLDRAAWTAFLVLFVVSTVLNFGEHARTGSAGTR
jgi:hypothetical protein